MTVLSPIRHWRIIDQNIEKNSVNTACLVAVLLTIVNTMCIDGCQYLSTGFSFAGLAFSFIDKHGVIMIFIVCIPYVILWGCMENMLKKNNYKFPKWWQCIYNKIPKLIKLILFLAFIIGPFYILSILLSKYEYLGNVKQKETTEMIDETKKEEYLPDKLTETEILKGLEELRQQNNTNSSQ